MIKIDENTVEGNIPIWNLKCNQNIEKNWFEFEKNWEDQGFGRSILVDTKNFPLIGLINYFTSEQVLHDLPLETMATAFLEEYPIKTITQLEFLKKSLDIGVKIVKDSVGTNFTPLMGNKLTFATIEIVLNDYLLTPTITFQDKNYWSEDEAIYTPSNDFLDGVFYLNSNKFYTGIQNKSKRDRYALVCEFTFRPLFSVDNIS